MWSNLTMFIIGPENVYRQDTGRQALGESTIGLHYGRLYTQIAVLSLVRDAQVYRSDASRSLRMTLTNLY